MDFQLLLWYIKMFDKILVRSLNVTTSGQQLKLRDIYILTISCYVLINTLSVSVHPAAFEAVKNICFFFYACQTKVILHSVKSML